MANPVEIRIPDIGDVDKVTVIELLVAAGERVEVDDGLITLESDKASMDVPTTVAGVVEKLLVQVGDEVGEGDPIVSLTVAEVGGVEEAAPAPSQLAVQETTQASPPPKAAAPAAQAKPTADIETEVLVLGSGPGGYTAAFRAADLGRRVVLVERYASLGGVCLNVGCIPSKALLHAARVLDEAAAFKEHGIDFGRPEIDLERLRDWKDSVVDQLTSDRNWARAKQAELEKQQAELEKDKAKLKAKGDALQTKLAQAERDEKALQKKLSRLQRALKRQDKPGVPKPPASETSSWN